MIQNARNRGTAVARGIVEKLGGKRAGRLAAIAGVVILAVMTTVPLYDAVKTELGVETAREANSNVESIEGAHEVVNAHAAALGTLAVRGDRDSAREVATAAGAIATNMDTVASAVGTDEPAAVRLLRAKREYLRSMRLAPGTQVNLAAIGPAQGALHTALFGVEAEWRSRSNGKLASLQASLKTTFATMPIAFLGGITLLALMWAVRLEARRGEAEKSVELSIRERQALTDSLTGAGNHRAFQEDLAGALDGAPGSPSKVGLAMLDLNDLKRVNNSQGHQAGDDRLRRVVEFLREGAPLGTVYRIGGDEFAIIQPETSAFEMLELVQKLQATLPQRSAPDVIELTAGVAEAGGRVAVDVLSGRADFALIAAKAARRGAMMFSPDLEVVAGSPLPATDRHAQRLATALARAVDAKDSSTQSHSETVSELCALIADELGLIPEQVADLRLAGLLHDVGKIGISDDILQKPSALTAEEYDLMKTHSAIGHRIVLGAGQEREAEWVLHAHERLDGDGYPDGLSGDEIPLESRIIHVADAFEAIIADRPYRKGRPAVEALEELDRHTGTQFDRECVTALKRGLKRGGAADATPQQATPEYEFAG